MDLPRPIFLTPTAFVPNDPKLWVVTHPVDDVFLPSSGPITMATGPYPRVLKRTGSTYMTPDSPVSPTMDRKICKWVKPVAERINIPKRRFPGPIPRIEPIKFTERNQLGRQNSQAKRGDRPTSVSTVRTFATPDLRAAPIFSPLNRPRRQLQSLDTADAQGLSQELFWALFARCAGCENFMTNRSIEEHICPDKTLSAGASVPLSETYFLWLLDTYHSDGSAGGVSKELFDQIFSVCNDCGSHMTERVSKYHKCNEPSGFEVLPWDLETPF